MVNEKDGDVYTPWRCNAVDSTPQVHSAACFCTGGCAEDDLTAFVGVDTAADAVLVAEVVSVAEDEEEEDPEVQEEDDADV